MIFYKIDKDGYYLTDENLEKPPYKTVKIPKTKWELIDEIPTPINYFEEVPTEELDGYVDVQPPQGLYRAKWNFETKEWVETGSKPTAQPTQPSEADRLVAVEAALLEIIIGGTA